jgi:ATP-dependent DNA ligase
MSTAICQLATPFQAANLQTFIEDDRWWFEPKLDGVRMLIEDGEPLVYRTRKGNEVYPPEKLAREMVFVPFTLDGELVGDTFYVFDAVLNRPLVERRSQLEEYYEDYAPRFVRLVPIAKTAEDKSRMVTALKDMGAEGVVIKDSLSTYTIGKSKSWLKLKFYTTYDLIVSELNRKGKDEAISIRWADGTDAGGCKVIRDKLSTLSVGDVIEVRCLGLSDSLKLIQPTFIRKRYDKDPTECLPD